MEKKYTINRSRLTITRFIVALESTYIPIYNILYYTEIREKDE